jgi:hypothetical protein
VLIVLVCFQVLDELVDAIGQQRDLNLGRAGVVGMNVILLNDLLFFIWTKCHGFLLTY